MVETEKPTADHKESSGLGIALLILAVSVGYIANGTCEGPTRLTVQGNSDAGFSIVTTGPMSVRDAGK